MSYVCVFLNSLTKKKKTCGVYFTFWCENQSFADNDVSCEFFGLSSHLGEKKTSIWQPQPLGNNWQPRLGLRLGGHVFPIVAASAVDFHILESYVTESRARATTVPLLQLSRTSLTVLIDDTELPLNYTNSDDTRLLWHFFLQFILENSSCEQTVIWIKWEHLEFSPIMLDL